MRACGRCGQAVCGLSKARWARRVHSVAGPGVAAAARLAAPETETAEAAKLDLLPFVQRLGDVAEHGVDDDFGALLREAGDVGHLLDERRLRKAAFGHGLVNRRKHQARASPAGDNFVRSDDSSGKTVVALATGTTAPPRPEATALAMPRPRTGNAGRPGRPVSFADDTRSAETAVRRISRQCTTRKERGNAARSPASRT